MEVGFIDLIAIWTAITISVVIFVPFTGVLVRFRANYNPKGLQLDPEGGAEPYTGMALDYSAFEINQCFFLGPVVQSYFGMMQRVYNIEVRLPCVSPNTRFNHDFL